MAIVAEFFLFRKCCVRGNTAQISRRFVRSVTVRGDEDALAVISYRYVAETTLANVVSARMKSGIAVYRPLVAIGLMEMLRWAPKL